MKQISTILKSIILTASISLLTLSTQTIQAKATTTSNINTTISDITDQSITFESINTNETYTADNSEGDFCGWIVGDKATITLRDNEVIQTRPTIDFKQFYKLGTNGTTYTNELVTDYDLQQYAVQFLKDNYNDTLDIPIVFNKIYNSSDSNIHINGLTLFNNNQATNIIIDSDLSGVLNQVDCERVLIHELIHYELSKQGNEFNDGTNTFETEVIAKGSCSNYGTEGILQPHVAINQFN